jgi:predicted  nucleic acid-binding Zn-ribbon protein
MFGNSGHITFTKDTLYFLTQCKKFSTKTTKVSNKPQNFDNTFFDEKLKAKNDQIYDLESKLKTQETKLNELNAIMDSKDANLRALNENYKEQIKSLKAEFGFQGDINNLLNEKVDSSEYKYALKIRDTTEKIKLKNLKIEELKLQIIEIETVIKQLRTLLDVKENDATMLDIIRSIRESKQKKSKEMGVRNEAVRNIEDLEKKNKMLEKKILGYKNEISLKKRILNGLPEIFKTNMNIKKNMQT